MKYYSGNTFFGYSDHFEHRAKYGTANSTSSEKGTDNKKNNTSEYNHQYYVKNKEKWAKRSNYSKDDKDFDEKNYDDKKNLIPNTDLYSFKNADGKTVVLFEDFKWTLPDGAELTSDVKKKLQELFASEDRSGIHDKISGVLNNGKSEEFDVDAAARDVIRGKYKNGAERKAALGEDYELVQKRVNEMMKQQKSSSNKSSESAAPTSSSKKSGENRTIQEAYEDHKAEKEKAKAAANAAQEKGKTRTEQEKKKQQKSVKHSDDVGSVFVRDLF